MEKKLAILMADLSGYTALTETHGALAAADLIDKYFQIVTDCLIGETHLHERTGDEIMIVSGSPTDLLATALLIGTKTSIEENFLRVHGGMHYGNVLQRANSYFGSAVNLAARIAAKANAGTFWCSEEFVNALPKGAALSLLSRGIHSFKNISKAIEVFELSIDDQKTLLIDPVCRMLIQDTRQAVEHPEETDTYFCSPDCLEVYASQGESGKIELRSAYNLH